MKEIKNYLCKLPIIIKITEGAFYLAFLFFVLALIEQNDYLIVGNFYRFSLATTLSCVACIFYDRLGLFFCNMILFFFVILNMIA